MSAETKYAHVSWTVGDVTQLTKEDVTDAQAEQFLRKHASEIQSVMIERVPAALERLLLADGFELDKGAEDV